MIIAVAQMGPVGRSEPRGRVVERLRAMMAQAHHRGAELVVFPELALTTFFPRWLIEDREELLSYYEAAMPSPDVQPLFDDAKRLGMAFSLGYAEREIANGSDTLYNTYISVDRSGAIVGKYRKIHVPGHSQYEPEREFQHLEKRYFAVGDLGFPVFDLDGIRTGMLICNDRRWPEAWRALGLQDANLVCVGYNTTLHNPEIAQHDHLVPFHHLLSMQAGAYQNGVWAAAAGKAGVEEGAGLLNMSCIVAPTGEVVAITSTFGDEVITADCDMSRCAEIRGNIFDFAKHRRPDQYGLLTQS